MPLKLRVISDHYKSLGPRRSQLFGVTGGTVGRASNNDWVLPDTKHFISSRHAKVIFRAGSWLLEDTSRNGVYLNGSDQRLSEIGPAKLEDGDRLKLGEYDVLVSIDEHNDFSADASGQMPLPSALRDVASPQSKRSRSDAKNSANKHGSFRSEPAPSEIKIDAYLQPDLDVTDLLVPAKVEKKDTLARSASIQLNVDGFAGIGDGGNAMADFCHGLGIDPTSLPRRDQSALLSAAGQLLRETAAQLSRTLKLQANRAAELELDFAASDELASPLQTARSIDAIIHRLLSTQSDRQVNGVDALQDAFERIRAHQDAFDAAIAPAVDELLSRVNPAKVISRFERSNPPASLFAAGKKAKYWDLISEVHIAIDQRDSRGWPTVFAREFAKSMSTKLREQKKRDE